jgi:hypothetical protein
MAHRCGSLRTFAFSALKAFNAEAAEIRRVWLTRILSVSNGSTLVRVALACCLILR